MGNINKKFNLRSTFKPAKQKQEALLAKSPLYNLGKPSPLNHDYPARHKHRNITQKKSEGRGFESVEGTDNEFMLIDEQELQPIEDYGNSRFYDKIVIDKDGNETSANQQISEYATQLSNMYNQGGITGGTFGGITADKNVTAKPLSINIRKQMYKGPKVTGSIFGRSNVSVPSSQQIGFTQPELAVDGQGQPIYNYDTESYEYVGGQAPVIPENQMTPQQVEELLRQSGGYINFNPETGMLEGGTGGAIDPNSPAASGRSSVYGYTARGQEEISPAATNFYQATSGGRGTSRYIQPGSDEYSNYYTDDDYMTNVNAAKAEKAKGIASNYQNAFERSGCNKSAAAARSSKCREYQRLINQYSSQAGL